MAKHLKDKNLTFYLTFGVINFAVWQNEEERQKARPQKILLKILQNFIQVLSLP